MNTEVLSREPYIGRSLKDFEVKGYELRVSKDRNRYRHFRQHVYRPKGTNLFKKNNSRLDTVKHYEERYFDVWEYHPIK